MKKVFINLSLTIVLALCLFSCEKTAPIKNATKTFVSTNDCNNTITLTLDGNNQFNAVISSDIPVYQDVEFAGYYLEGNNFIILKGIWGDPLTLKKVDDLYLPDGMSEVNALGKGWKMKQSK